MSQTWRVVKELESSQVQAVVPNLKEMQQQGWLLIGISSDKRKTTARYHLA